MSRGSGSVAEAPRIADVSVGELLRLLGGGAPGEILLALRREGPTQTKILTGSLRGYTARTTYRYLSRLGEIGALERDDDPEGPARVVHTLSSPAGEELAELIYRFAAASLAHLPGGQVDSREWTSLGLLADLWEAGVVQALSRGPTSPRQLTGKRCPLSYHQLSRRAARFKAAGFFEEATQSRRQRRVYALTPKARRAVGGLIVGIGRWRRRNLGDDRQEGLTAIEMITTLRTLQPLGEPSERPAGELRFCVEDARTGEELWTSNGSPRPWARGTVEDWMDLLLDGEQRVEVGGDPALVRERLARLHEGLWTPAESASLERG